MKKTTKSPEETEITPSKKKLKQARLPFMLLSDVSPKSESPGPRKRKLSVPETVPATKLVKTSKENNITKELVVISDEDSKDLPSPKKQEVLLNPYIKLVDAARKKKIQKTKGQRKAKNKSGNKVKSDENVVEDNDISCCEDVEMAEAPSQAQKDVELNDVTDQKQSLDSQTIEKNNNTKNKNAQKNKPTDKKVVKKSPKNRKTSKSPVKKVIKVEDSKIVCIEDSIDAADINMSQSDDAESQDKNVQSIEDNIKAAIEKNTAQTIKQDSKEPVNILTPRRTPRSTTNTDQKKSNEEIPVDKKAEQNKTSDKTQKKSEITSDSDSEDKQRESEKTEDSKSSSDEPATPKRSTRNKTKDNDSSSLNESISSKLDESMVSNPSTPKHNKSMSDNADKSLNGSISSANLTPKQLQKKVEAAKRREEKEKEKLEREKKRQQEKEERAKQRQEKEDQKKREREEKEDAKKKEREEKEDLRRKEKEEKEKQRETEKKLREMKEEQKRKEREDKEEQRKKEKEAREEEKRKRQEALEMEKQEQELKKKKAAEAFVNFFVPKQKGDKEPGTVENGMSQNSMLSSFTVKADMRLAPTVRTDLNEERREVLDKLMEEQKCSESLYLKCLKDGSAKPLSSGRTWQLDDKDDDVMIVEDELPPLEDVAGEVITCESAPRLKLRPKLLSFHANRRPPYWGTWRKKSDFVKPRRPFAQDEKQLDYEVDSDDDWEDEGDGESLDGSAGGSDDEAPADDYEVDNELFVPHGYLSDEEATMDEDDMLSLSPETQAARLKHLEDEFELELKKPTEKLKPRLYGLLWENSNGGKPDKCVDALWNYFEKFSMIMNDVTPLLQPSAEPEETEKKKNKKKKVKADDETKEQSPKSKKKKKQEPENKEGKNADDKKAKKPNQPGINSFLQKVTTK